MNQNKIFRLIIFLSILGLLASSYLVYNHYSTEGSICDISKNISCSSVSISSFAELFNVPVAIFGMVWFTILLLMSIKTFKEDGELIAAVFAWNVIGLLFVFYFIIAEFILKTLCPVCTIVHVLVIIILVLSYLLYKQSNIRLQRSYLKKLKKWIFWIIVANLIIILIFNFPLGNGKVEALAQCLTEKGVSVYSSSHCGACARQRTLFGDAYEFINEIECNPDAENSQINLCTEKDIKGTPTWVTELNRKEVKRHAGYLELEELREFAGCE